jgi:hypothetical protein
MIRNQLQRVRLSISIVVSRQPHFMNMEGQRLTGDHPTWRGMALFFLKSRALQVKRGIENALSRFAALREGSTTDFPFILSESVSPLHTVTDPREQPLQLGKIQNLRLACR